MSETTSELSLLEELDARQEEVLEALDELNFRIERLLSECLAGRTETPGVSNGTASA